MENKRKAYWFSFDDSVRALEVTEATAKATQVKSFTPKIKVQQTYDTESRILNKEIEHEVTYEDVHCIDYVIDSYLLVVKGLHPILSRLLLMEKIQRIFLVAFIYMSILGLCFNSLILTHYKTWGRVFSNRGKMIWMKKKGNLSHIRILEFILIF